MLYHLREELQTGSQDWDPFCLEGEVGTRYSFYLSFLFLAALETILTQQINLISAVSLKSYFLVLVIILEQIL